MKNRKLFAALLACVMMTSLAACSSAAKETEEPAETETEAASETEDVTTIADPWTDTDADGIMENIGVSFNVPEGAEDVIYRMDTEEGLAEMDYTTADGIAVTARIGSTAEAEDISGMYYTWSSEETATVGDYCEATVYEAEDEDQMIKLCTWYDAVPGFSYSVSAEGSDLSDFDIVSEADSIYVQMQGDAESDVPDYIGTYTCSDDSSTIVFAEDNTVDISITRLAEIEGTVDSYEDGVVTIAAQDPNGEDMTLTFNTETKELTVTDSAWDLLPNDTVFTFDA